MALDGAAFAGWADRLTRYLEGKTPLELVPVGGGAAVPFVHDARREDPSLLEPGMLDRPVLIVMTRQRLETAAQYLHDGGQWTVEDVDPEAMAGTPWPHRATLVRHAG